MKICKKCGTCLEDEVLFCVSCGTVQPVLEVKKQTKERDIEQIQVPFTESRREEQSDFEANKQDSLSSQEVFNSNDTRPKAKKKKSKKTLIFGIVSGTVALVAVIVGFLFVAGVIGSEEPKEIIEEYLEAIETMNAEEMTDCMACSSEYEDKYFEKIECIRESFKIINSEGTIVENNCKIGEIKKLSDKEEKEFWKYVGWYGGMVDKKEVEDLRKCEVSYTIYSWVGREEKNVNFDLYIGKYEGEWKIISSDF